MNALALGSLSVSRLAYGCWRITGHPESADLDDNSLPLARTAVLTAHESGYTLFDLADIYAHSNSETLFGRILRETPSLRSTARIATKCGIRRANTPTAGDPYRYDFSADYIKQSCEGSLRRLGVETLHLYQLHRPDFLMNPEEVGAAFQQLHREGKVLEFGVSNFLPSQVHTLQRHCPVPIRVNQVEINLLNLHTLQNGTLDQCLADGILPMAWSPLAGGRLPGDPQPSQPAIARIHQALDTLALETGRTRTQLALAWLLLHPARIIPIVGSTRPDRIRAAASSLDHPLSREQWYRLTEAACGQRLP